MNAPHSKYPYSRHTTKRLIRWLAALYQLRIATRKELDGNFPDMSRRNKHWREYQNLQIACVSIRHTLDKRQVSPIFVDREIKRLCRKA